MSKRLFPLLLLLLPSGGDAMAETPFCPKLQLRATPEAREGYACQALAEGLALCYLCEDRPIATAQLSRAGLSLDQLQAQARSQTAPALHAGRPMRLEIHDMPGHHYWVSAEGDGLDVAALLHPERLQGLLGAPPVLAIPGEGTLLAWIPGDPDTDTVLAVGAQRMHAQARRPVSPRVYHHTDGQWAVWGEATPTSAVP